MKHVLFFFLFVLSTSAADMTDFDNDGLPDLWEANFGLSTNRATGIDGAMGDPDNDGLSNMAEYLAGYVVAAGSTYSNYTFAVSGLNPTNAYSIMAGLQDGFCRVSTNKVPLSWMFGDHDMVDQSWELVATNGASAFLPDAEVDSAGWTIYDRCRMALAKRSPAVNLRLTYFGPQTIGPVTVMAFSDLSMGYNAKWTVTGANKTHLLDTPDDGALRKGSCYWLAYSGDGVWVNGAPIGCAMTASNNWDVTSVDIDLPEYTGHRFAYNFPSPVFSPGSQKSESRIRIRRYIVDGTTVYQMIVLDKTVLSSGQMLSQIDWLKKGQQALDWGLSGVSTSLGRTLVGYEVFLGTEPVLTNNSLLVVFTNILDSVQRRATKLCPSGGGTVTMARPKFRFDIPSGYQAFDIEIKKDSLAGTTVYRANETPTPVKTQTGDCEWLAPLSVGDLLASGNVFSNNCTYAWRVACLNEKFSQYTEGDPILWSDWQTFCTRVDSMPGSSGTILASVRYSGAATNLANRIIVEARTARGTTEYPACRYTLEAAQVALSTNLAVGATNVYLRGLAPGTYYVSAYIDSNTNRIRDTWESWGYTNMRGAEEYAAYDFRPVTVRASAIPATASLIIEDMDTDADWYPDAWEFEKTGATGSGNWLGTYGPSPNPVNPLLQ